MKALPLCFGILLASLQLPKETNSWSPSTWCTTFSRRTSPRTIPTLTVSFATKDDGEAKVSQKKKNSNRGEEEDSFDIRKHRYYDRFERFLGSEIGLTNQTQVKRIAERCPGVLHYTEARLNETLNLFRGHFDFSNEELEKIIRREPIIFGFSVRNLEDKLMNICRCIFDFDMSSVGILMKKQPSVLNFNVEKNLIPKVNYLREEVFQGDSEALREVLLRNPAIFTLSLNRRIIPRAEALRRQGFNPSDNIPSWSLISVKRFEKWFKKKTGVPLPDNWCPPRNGCQEQLTFEQRMQERLTLLSTELSLDNEEARTLIERIPSINSLSMENLKKKLKDFVELFGSSEEKARDAILIQPSLLAVSFDSLKPKFAYLRQTLYHRNEDDFISIITANPIAFVTRSLEKRIKPRIEATIAAGLNPSDLNIDRMMLQTDDQFPQWLKKQQQKSLHD